MQCSGESFEAESSLFKRRMKSHNNYRKDELKIIQQAQNNDNYLHRTRIELTEYRNLILKNTKRRKDSTFLFEVGYTAQTRVLYQEITDLLSDFQNYSL